MKRASFILIKVGMILSFVAGGLILVYGLIITVGGQTIRNLFDEASAQGNASSSESAEMAYHVVMGLYTFLGIYLLVLGGLSLANGFICKSVRSNPTRSGYIICIVFGFLSLCIVNSVGGILGICALNQEERNYNY